MPRTVDEPEVAPPLTDWEREEQEKLPPRGEGSQDNQGKDRRPDQDTTEKEPEPPNPDVLPSSELADKLGPYTRTVS